jgi:hypothetical protein
MTLSFPGATVTINVYGPSVDDIRTVVASEIAAALTPLETQMSSDFLNFAADQGSKIDVLTAGIADIAADVQVLLDKAAQAGVFTQEEQDAATALTGKLDALKSAVSGLNDEVGDQDGSDTPAEPPADQTPAA